MKIIVNNLAVEYQDEGNGPVMLLLHGWMDTLHTFDALVPAFSYSWRVIRVDLQGFGGSEVPKQPWSVGDYAHFVQDFCSKLNIKPKVLVGHSFGGRVLIKGVAERVLHPEKIILIASAGIASHKKLKALFFLCVAKIGKVLLYLLPKQVSEHFRRMLYGTAGSWDYIHVHNQVLKKTFLKAIHEDLSEAAKTICVPTLLIWGERDIITPLGDGKRLQSLISGSRLEVLSGACHLVHQEKSAEVAKLIREFTL